MLLVRPSEHLSAHPSYYSTTRWLLSSLVRRGGEGGGGEGVVRVIGRARGGQVVRVGMGR